MKAKGPQKYVPVFVGAVLGIYLMRGVPWKAEYNLGKLGSMKSSERGSLFSPPNNLGSGADLSYGRFGIEVLVILGAGAVIVFWSGSD